MAKLIRVLTNESFQKTVLAVTLLVFIVAGGWVGWAVAHHPSFLSFAGLVFLTFFGAAFISMGNDTGCDYFGNRRGHPLEAVFGGLLLLSMWGTLIYYGLEAAKRAA